LEALLNSKELLKYLQELGATFQQGKGSHVKVFLNGKQSVIPIHGSRELAKGTEAIILKQLGLKKRRK
jgi:mRNA interferase HicA